MESHLCEGGDGVGAVQKLPPLFQQPSRRLCDDLQLLLTLYVFTFSRSLELWTYERFLSVIQG